MLPWKEHGVVRFQFSSHSPHGRAAFADCVPVCGAGGGFCRSHDCSTPAPRVPQKSHGKYKLWNKRKVEVNRQGHKKESLVFGKGGCEDSIKVSSENSI